MLRNPVFGRRSHPRRATCCHLLAVAVVVCVGLGAAARARADDGTSGKSASSASLDPAPVRSEPGLIVVTAEEIARRGWRTVADVLQHQPGLHISQAGGIGQRARLLFRGQASGGVLLRLDGVEITDPLRRDPGVIVPDLLAIDIDHIEIRRGPRSVEYGSDALGGVIDIYTRRGEGRATPWVRTEAGSYGTIQSSAGVSGSVDRLGYAFSYTNLHSRGVSAFRRDLASSGERDGYDNETATARLDLALTEALSVSVSGRLVDTQLDVDGNDMNLAQDRLLVQPNVLDSGDLAAAKLDARQLFLHGDMSLLLFGGRWRQQLEVGYVGQDRASRDFGDFDPAVQFAFAPTIRIVDARHFGGDGSDSTRLALAWRHEIVLSPEHTLSLGFETERESLHRSTFRSQDLTAQVDLDAVFAPFRDVFPDAPRGLAPPRSDRVLRATASHASARNFSLYAGDQFSIGRLQGQVGVRLNDHDEAGSRLGYRAALSYDEPITGSRLFASVGAASRDPDLSLVSQTRLVLRELIVVDGVATDAFPFDQRLPLVAPGNSRFGDATSRGVELGAEIPLPLDAGQITLSLFATRVRGVPGFQLVTFGSESFLALEDRTEQRVHGVEASGRFDLGSSAGLTLGYTYTSSELRHASAPGLTPLSGEDTREIPKHLLSASLSVRPLDGLELVAGLRYVGRRKSGLAVAIPEGRTLGGFTTFDFAVGYEVYDGLRITANLVNAFDKSYHDPVESNSFERAGFVGVELSY